MRATLRAFLIRRALLGVVVAIAGCASPTGQVPASDATAGAGTPSVGAPEGAWAAVIETAADPDRLAAGRTETLAALGEVLEGSVVISPGECLEGLPEGMSDGYVLAIVRSGREDVQALASQLQREPSFIGAVTVVCSD